VKVTREQIETLKNLLPTASNDEKRKILELIKVWDAQSVQNLGKDNLLEFADHVYPGYKVGPHHLKLAQIFEDIANGKKKRVIVNIAPRHGKSELISYLLQHGFWVNTPIKRSSWPPTLPIWR
jgi:hypothetical protein